MKRIKIRKGSIAYYTQKTWKPVSLLLFMTILIFLMSCAEAENIAPAEPVEEVIEIVEEDVIYVEQTAIYALSDEERDLVERVVAAEARGESIECQMAVAQTIKDRCLTRGQTVTEVCTAPYQFATPYQGEVSEKVQDAVRFTFDNGDSVLEYPTTHFYAWKLIDEPYWTADKEFRGQIDGTRFYGDKEKQHE